MLTHSNNSNVYKQFRRRLLDFRNAPFRQQVKVKVLIALISVPLILLMITRALYGNTVIDESTSFSPQFGSPPTLLVAIMSAPWDTARRRLSERTCSGFKAQNIECILFDADDVTKMDRFEDHPQLRHYIEETKVINKEWVRDSWDTKRGKIGHTLTFLMMMEWLKTKTFDYVLFLEDDAEIPNIATFSEEMMTEYLPTVHYDVDGVFKELDAIHLSRSRCDNVWFRWMAFKNPNGNSIGLWENRSGALSRFWMGKAAILFSRKWIDHSLDEFLYRRPIDYHVDIWMTRFIVDGSLKMFTICPNMVNQANQQLFPSVIRGTSRMSAEKVKRERNASHRISDHPYFSSLLRETIICLLYTMMAVAIPIFGSLAIARVIFRWSNRLYIALSVTLTLFTFLIVIRALFKALTWI